jgi:hypothetical protein
MPQISDVTPTIANVASQLAPVAPELTPVPSRFALVGLAKISSNLTPIGVQLPLVRANFASIATDFVAMCLSLYTRSGECHYRSGSENSGEHHSSGCFVR